LAIGLAVNGDRPDIHFPGASHNAQRNFSPVGNQYFADFWHV
jgi:hypothetical protein